MKKTRIFSVDDHALIRRGLATLIAAESDMEMCGQAEDASTGLKEIIKLQPDLVVVDITLNGNSGLELIKGIHAYNPKTLIMALSMHDEAVYGARAIRAGARAYVMKHALLGKVIEAIRHIRNGDLYISDEIASAMLSGAAGTEENEPMIASLSDRELEVVNLIGRGLLTREIAVRLHLSMKTIESHRAHIKTKVRVENGSQLVQFCVRWVDENHKRRA